MWIGIIGIMLLIIGVCVFKNSWIREKNLNNGVFTFNWIVGIAGCVSLIAAAISYPASYSTLADMKAFFTDTHAVYKQMAAENKQAVIVRTVSGSAIYKTIPAMHLKRIEWFNDLYRYYKLWQDHWFIGGYIGRMSPELRPITEYKYQP